MDLNRYRVDREWKRYEGTPQRDLFRELRIRFLERHPATGGWSVDVGAGPGRFAPFVGAVERTVQLDLSDEMLRSGRERAIRTRSPVPISVRGDALHPPLRVGRFSHVVALGNPLGFSGPDAETFLDRIAPLLQPGGTLVVEVVCGPGESARYLERLPPGAVRRLLAAPMNIVRARVDREGFRRSAEDRGDHAGFRRFSPAEILARLRSSGIEPLESMAVAPALGGDPERVAAVRSDPPAWRHLLELEETLGRSPARWPAAAAFLIAGRRAEGDSASPVPPPKRVIK